MRSSSSEIKCEQVQELPVGKVLALKWLKTSFDEVVLRDSQKCWTFFNSIVP